MNNYLYDIHGVEIEVGDKVYCPVKNWDTGRTEIHLQTVEEIFQCSNSLTLSGNDYVELDKYDVVVQRESV